MAINTLRKQKEQGLKLVFGLVILFWIIEIVNQMFFGGSFTKYGLLPRSPDHLMGILASPFLHGGFPHLISNSIPFLVMGSIIALRSVINFAYLFAFLTVVGGLIVFVFGREAYHVGASGVIFGFFGYILANAFYEKTFIAVIIAMGIGFMYSTLIWGIFPDVSKSNVSWEGHAAGFGAGILYSKLTANWSNKYPKQIGEKK